MPELAEFAACGKWNPNWKIHKSLCNPSSRVYHDLLPKDVVSALTKAKLTLNNSWKANAIQA